MEYYQSPVPCKKCGATYVLTKKYEDTHIAIRDYCIECYCLKWEDLEKDRENQLLEEDRKEREERLERLDHDYIKIMRERLDEVKVRRRYK